MRFGILTLMPHVHKHGTVNLLLGNLKIIVIMNHYLEHVKVSTQGRLLGNLGIRVVHFE